MKKQMTVRKTVLAALFLAIGLILPFITMQIPAVGKMLCPMHIPVLLCGYILGGPYGLIVGFITPLLRSVTFGMPVMLPNAICMAFELATYGLVSGILSGKMKKEVSAETAQHGIARHLHEHIRKRHDKAGDAEHGNALDTVPVRTETAEIQL